MIPNDTQFDTHAFADMWKEVAKSKSYCPHDGAVTIDENDVYHFNCRQCGLVGMASYKTANELGWTLGDKGDVK